MEVEGASHKAGLEVGGQNIFPQTLSGTILKRSTPVAVILSPSFHFHYSIYEEHVTFSSFEQYRFNKRYALCPMPACGRQAL